MQEIQNCLNDLKYLRGAFFSLSCEDRCVRADGSPRFHKRFHDGFVLLASRENIVCEGCIRSDENVVFEGDALPQLHAALVSNSVSEGDVALDENVVADIAVLSDHDIWENMRECPDIRACPDLRPWFNNRFLMNECPQARSPIVSVKKSLFSQFIGFSYSYYYTRISRQHESPVS